MRSYLLRQALKKMPQRTPYAGWTHVGIVQLLVDETPGMPRPECAALIKLLKSEGKQVEVITFYNSRKPKTEVPLGSYFRSDLNICRKPRQIVFGRLEQKAEVLIDWSLNATSPNDFLAAWSTATLKIGIDNTMPCFDVSISSTGNMPNMVIEEIVKYIKMINND